MANTSNDSNHCISCIVKAGYKPQGAFQLHFYMKKRRKFFIPAIRLHLISSPGFFRRFRLAAQRVCNVHIPSISVNITHKILNKQRLYVSVVFVANGGLLSSICKTDNQTENTSHYWIWIVCFYSLDVCCSVAGFVFGMIKEQWANNLPYGHIITKKLSKIEWISIPLFRRSICVERLPASLWIEEKWFDHNF